jgi:hypothetical protein
MTYANLRRLAGNDKQIAEVIRVAIREYLDNQGELTGSRRYFTGRFRDEVHTLREELSWHLTLITILLVELLSFLIRNTVSMDEEDAKSFSPTEILKFAEERTVESGWRVRDRVRVAIDGASLEEQRYKDGTT